MTYMAKPKHKNPCPGGHENYNFLDAWVTQMT